MNKYIITILSFLLIFLGTTFSFAGSSKSESIDSQQDLTKIINKLYNLIWTGDKEELRTFTLYNGVTISFILEKLRSEAPVNQKAKIAINYVHNAVFNVDPLLAPNNTNVIPFFSLKNNRRSMLILASPYSRWNELSYNDFRSILGIITQMPSFRGASTLVKFNQKNVERFINEAVSKGLHQNTLYYDISCELAFLYRNHYHTRELLSQIDNSAGGVNAYLENRNALGIKITITENDALDFFLDQKKRIGELILNKQYDEATKYLSSQYVTTDIIFSDNNHLLLAAKKDKVYPDIIFLYAVISIRNGDYFTADYLIDYLTNKGYYSALLISDDDFKKNIKLIDKVFDEYRERNVELFSTLDLLQSITGRNYSKFELEMDLFVTESHSMECSSELNDKGKMMASKIEALHTDLIPLNVAKKFVLSVVNQCASKTQQLNKQVEQKGL